MPCNVNSSATGVRVPGKRTLKILLVAPSLDSVGGQSVQANLLLKGLGNSRSLEVMFQPIDPRLPFPFRGLQRVKYIRTLCTFALYVAQLTKAMRRCDLVHVFSASYFSFLLAPTPAIYLARYLKKPIILNYHSGEAEDHLRRWPSARKALSQVDRLVVPSGYLADVFKQFGLQAQVVSNAVDLGAFRFRRRPAPRPMFLVNRNFEAHYGVDCVLRAFAEIQRQCSEASLTVAGDGPLRASLHELAEALSLRNIRFVGRVTPERMPALYDEHDLWLNASTVDNMPLSILEAYASGLAVVTTGAGGIPYIVENNRTGMVVKGGDCESLATAALTLVRQPELFFQLVTNGREECKKYTWDMVRQGWESVYAELGPLHKESARTT